VPGWRLKCRSEFNCAFLATVVVLVFWPAPVLAQVEVRLLQSQYLSDAQNQAQTDSYSSLGISMRLESGQDTSRWRTGFDLTGLASVDGTEQAYVAAPQGYVTWQPPQAKGLSVTLGRKIETWSRFDREWRLGVWQPYVRWDYLHPIEQGLTGLFVSGKNKDVAITAFATGIFLPDQGPDFEVEDGEFHSSNRWFRQPGSRHTVFNQDRRLNYELERPAEKDIVLHAGYGLTLLVGNEKSGAWLRTSLANKPINQLHIGIEGYHSISQTNHFLESIAIVHPRVARHNVATVEAGYQQDSYAGWVSLTEESPHDPNLPKEWEESKLNPSRFFGASVMHRLPWQGFRRHWLKYSYMHVSEAVREPENGVIEDDLESSLDRYPYKRVVGVEWDAPLLDRARQKLNFSVRYLYSIPEEGALLSAGVDYLPNPRTRWSLGVDVLGANREPGDEDAGLMSLYRNNDRVMGGVSYVF
jgi:hypothetical protein